jgi:6-pyruvoyl-tetrahydropterin synthase
MLRDITAPFNNRNLNETPPFNQPGEGENPTAEHVARHIGEEMGQAITRSGGKIHLAWVRLTEAPGCAVTWTSGAAG